MRKFLTSLKTVIVLILTIGLFSCTTGDDTILVEDQSENKIVFDGETYQINSGYFDNGSSPDYSLALYPVGITIKDGNNNNVFNGGDWFLEIEPLKTDDDTIEGTYTAGEDVFVYFINNAHFIDDELQPGKIVHEVSQNGTLTINKIGSEYEFIYNAFDNTGKPFTVNYKGPLTALIYQ